jgi:hypothetical protein
MQKRPELKEKEIQISGREKAPSIKKPLKTFCSPLMRLKEFYYYRIRF